MDKDGFGITGYPPKKWWSPFLILYAKITSKWTIDLNVRVRTIKLLGEKDNLCDLGLGKAFISMTTKAHFLIGSLFFLLIQGGLKHILGFIFLFKFNI